MINTHTLKVKGKNIFKIFTGAYRNHMTWSFMLRCSLIEKKIEFFKTFHNNNNYKRSNANIMLKLTRFKNELLNQRYYIDIGRM